MIEREIIVNHMAGLHSKTASVFVQTAGQFKSKIWAKNERCTVSAKSLLGILTLNVREL